MKLLLVAGARPNFMKIAPVIREIRRRPAEFEYCLVHTGQHYDEGMSDVFFRDLEIPAPHHHLNVGSGSHAVQTATIMTAFEPVLMAEDPACVLVFGDVNSTLAATLAAVKIDIPVAHVEAGLRSSTKLSLTLTKTTANHWSGACHPKINSNTGLNKQNSYLRS